ncbi:unnamed protein product [Closterium sp. NIES-65]|nr:unnamed protein product [Closterium sp. NIES-65]
MPAGTLTGLGPEGVGVPPVAPGRSASSAPLVAVERPERSPMDFLGALGRDCTAESDPAPRPLPLARPAASVPVAPPASADQIRRRFEDQQRELARRAGSVRPVVAHRQLATISGRAAAMIVTVRPVHRRLLVHLVAWRRGADPVTSARIVIVRLLIVHLASGRLPARRLGVGPQLRIRPLLQNANGSTPLVVGTVILVASVSRAHLARSRLCARAQVGVRIVGDGGVTVAAEKAGPAPSAMERRLLDRLDDVEKELRRSRAGSASPSAPLAAPVVPLSALLPHNPFGSPARSERPLVVGMGFVGAGGEPPWAQFAPPRPLPAPRDLRVSTHRARASALLPPMKEVPTATLARLCWLAASLQSLEQILQESFDSMPVSPPSRFSQKPRADCHAAASALFALVTPLQVAPSPGATSASQLADSALALRTLVAGPGTPVDVVGATVSVVRQLWLNTSGMLAAVEADRM